MRLKQGLYEKVINLALEEGLKEIDPQEVLIEIEPLDQGEAQHVLSRYLAEVLQHGLVCIKDRFGENDAFKRQIEVCNRIIKYLAAKANDRELLDWCIGTKARQLLALFEKRNTMFALSKTKVLRPVTPLSQSSLFTGSVVEPSMVNELKKEIVTADHIDMLVSFIKWSGLRLILDELKEFTQTRPLRIITTSYMGATDLKAIKELCHLPNTQIKVSYDTKVTRLHAKAYAFYRGTGFSTAYIGSSNLSNAAISSGLEWNIKVTERDMPHIIKNIAGTFEAYWNDLDFVSYQAKDEPVLRRALQSELLPNDMQFSFDIQPYQFQKEILEKLDAERKLHRRYRNLIVAATGTGKTVVSAFDYKRFCRDNPGKPNRLLFVAHRREILTQSQSCFRTILRNANFGELYDGLNQPTRIDHLFMTIQTFNSQDFHHLTTPDYYDFIIVDEFHHAAAKSYQDLLTWYKPKILLGLTATPERLDGRDILDYFDGHIAAEIRLPEAINRQLLSPFQYFGVTDEVDLSQITFERGRYDIGELEKVYTANDIRAKAVQRALERYVTSLDGVIGLGFCVSVNHAIYMAKRFTEWGIPSLALHGQSTLDDRETAKRRLINQEIRFIFTVDLYNEGVDIPEVNTVMFLRPTESLTVFLQQLGRGLRLCEGKDVLTVLDFIGQAHKKYNFEWKFRALLGNTKYSIQKEIEQDFLTLPRGCFIKMEKVAKEYVLSNIRGSLNNRMNLINKLRTFTSDFGMQPTLTTFLSQYDLKPSDLYRVDTLSRLCVQAGIKKNFDFPNEDAVRKALRRMTHVNSRRWIDFLLTILKDELPDRLSEEEERLLQMFYAMVWQKPLKDLGFSNIRDGIFLLMGCQPLYNEMIELLEWNYEAIDFVDEPVEVGFPCPLDLHCTYSRDEILAAVGYLTAETRPVMQSGVLYLRDYNTDLLFVTLNKTEKDYSPTTLYDDYAINSTLFHWQSQSTTAADSPTGQRYIHQRTSGGKVMLFVRENKRTDNQTEPYIYLGLVDYISHISSKPMSITWELRREMPAGMVNRANKMIIG